MKKSVVKNDKKNRLYNLLSMVALLLLILSCAKVADSESEKQQVLEAILPEISERLAFDNCWTTVGATGIVDRNSRDVIHLGEKIDGDVITTGDSNPDLTNIKTYAGVAYLLSSRKGIYHIRYPINQQFIYNIDLAAPNNWVLNLQSRYKVENKDMERIVIHLNRYKLYRPAKSEQVETIMTLDSDSFGVSPGFQNQSIKKDNFAFNFREYGYFIDAQFINKSNTTIPTTTHKGVGTAIGLIQLCTVLDLDVD